MSALQLYKVTLTAKSPLFVGSGNSYTKKDYLYDNRTHVATMIDTAKLMQWLVASGRPSLLDEYEKFMLGSTTLDVFFRTVGISQDEKKEMSIYRTDANSAINDNGTLAEIKEFTRDSNKSPYVPGSSLKGALRTVLLVKKLRDCGASPQLPDIARGSRNEKKMAAQDMESNFLNTLCKTSRIHDALNCAMRGISISDSELISQHDMVLAKKIDWHTDGQQTTEQTRQRHPLNLIRECVRPGTEIRFSLSVDLENNGGIDSQYIINAVKEFGAYYKSSFSDKFRLPYNDSGETFKDCLLLGGGCGYFSKNIVYPGRPWNEAVAYVADVMCGNFRNGGHSRDMAKGISPHTLKYTEYRPGADKQVRSYQFGVCHFAIEPIKC